MISKAKVYHKKNFHSRTFCTWKEVLPEAVSRLKINYQSDSGSRYAFTTEGVYRISNHWGRVGNCYWRIASLENYKNQQLAIAYANWTDFCLNDEKEKLFFITVDYQNKKVAFHHKDSGYPKGQAVFKSAGEIVKTTKLIKTILTENHWAKHLNYDNFETIQQSVIEQLVCTDKSFLEIKKAFY